MMPLPTAGDGRDLRFIVEPNDLLGYEPRRAVHAVTLTDGSIRIMEIAEPIWDPLRTAPETLLGLAKQRKGKGRFIAPARHQLAGKLELAGESRHRYCSARRAGNNAAGRDLRLWYRNATRSTQSPPMTASAAIRPLRPWCLCPYELLGLNQIILIVVGGRCLAFDFITDFTTQRNSIATVVSTQV